MNRLLENSKACVSVKATGITMHKKLAKACNGSCCVMALFAAALMMPLSSYANDDPEAVPLEFVNEKRSVKVEAVQKNNTDVAPQPECMGEGCEQEVGAATEQSIKPAYTLKIITYAEGQPEAANLSEKGLQANRRVDVTIIGEPEVAEIESKVEMSDGGIIWITKDPLELNRQLAITTAATINTVDDQVSDPVRFRLLTNYASYLTRWEVLFFDAEDDDLSNPVATIDGETLGYESELEWNGVLDTGKSIAKGDELNYVLRVYDSAGRVDETFPQALRVAGPARNIESVETQTLEESALDARKQIRPLARSEVDIRGSRVRIYGRDLNDAQSLSINGEKITLDDRNAFASEYLLPIGKHNFNVEISNQDGSVSTKELSVDLDDEYLFLVALADVTLGKNTVSGSVDKLEVADDSRYNGDLFVDGRLAFYLKGKIKGKYLVTAQLDTGTEDIDNVFKDFNRADPSSVFRRLDPEQYYPVYGDDSTVIDDTDSQGKLYVRVDWDQSRALWGNFNSGVTGTELARFNRSLYGAQLRSRSKSFTSHGEHRTDLNVFAAEALSAHRHNEFLGTGGSLYYLSDQDIVGGSEKIAVEVRDRESERVIERVTLVEGRDYQIDDFQGRIILSRPLQSIGGTSAPSIIKDTPLDGNEIWLIADYEYVPSAFKEDEATVGVRGKQWLNDHVAVGGTWVRDRREGFDHQIKGVDATLRTGTGTWLKAEFAQSNNVQTAGSFISGDGGLTFTPFASNISPDPTEGNAYGLEARIDLAELRDWSRESSMGAWFKRRNKDFSSSSFDAGNAVIDAGAEASINATERVSLSARATHTERVNIDLRQTGSVQAEVKLLDRLAVSGELRQIHEEDVVADSTGDGSIGALRIGVDVNDNVNVYGSTQRTLEATGSYVPNDLNTLGIKTGNGQKLSLNAEASSGDRGDSLLFGADFKVTDGYSLYASHTLNTDRTDAVRNTTTVGQRRKLGTKLRVFTEHQFSDEDQKAGIGHTFGLDYNATKYTTLNFSYQMATLNDDVAGETDRDAVSFGLSYKSQKTKASTRFEYRRDKNVTGATEQWLTANTFNVHASPSVRWQGKLNFSQTEDQQSGDADARFAEAGIGFALRPYSNDRLNMLGRITYKYDLPPIGQSASMDERALVGSLEGAFQINQRWEIGGKLAYKESEIRNARDSGAWFSNDAMLAATRLRYHLLFKWDALAEYHWLSSDASNDVAHGALFAVGRQVGDNLKFSVGYNFTRFDDSLLNDNIDIGGWFVNLVGKY